MRIESEFEGVVFAGASEGAVRLRVQVGRMAPYYRTALVVGEAGSGKREVARELHRMSAAAGDFVSCTAAELTDDLVDRSKFGTLYLNGLERLKTEDQDTLMARLSRLERLIRARAAETRMVCASESEIKGMVATGRMRPDLYTRVGGMEIRVPALRERLEDLPALLGEVRVSADAMERMQAYCWPGNLSELSEVLRKGLEASEGGLIRVDHLPELTMGERAQTVVLKLDEVMRQHVADVLERCSGNKLKASELLGISRSTLYRMLDIGAA